MIAAVRKAGAAVQPDHRRRRRRRDPLRRAARPASTSISASAARRKACWRRRRCAASAARCRCRLVLDTEELRERTLKMGIKDRARRNTRSRTWCAATACSPRPASPPARCCNGVQVRQGHDRDRHRGDALGHRHGAPDRRRAPPAREIPSGLKSCRVGLTQLLLASRVGARGVLRLGRAGAWPLVCGTVRPAVFGAGLGAGPGAVGRGRLRIARLGGRAGRRCVWPRSPMPTRNTKPNRITRAPMPKPDASRNSVPVAAGGHAVLRRHERLAMTGNAVVHRVATLATGHDVS